MPFFQPIAASAEPMLWTSIYGGILIGAGLVIRFFAKAVLEARDGVRGILQTLHGPKDALGTGFVAKMEKNHEETKAGLQTLANRDTEFERRLTKTEQWCKFNHGSSE